MKTKENSEPRKLMAATVLLMLLSAASMLTIGLASNSAATAPSHFAASAHPAAAALSHPARSSQGAHLGALRGRISRWVAWFARSG